MHADNSIDENEILQRILPNFHIKVHNETETLHCIMAYLPGEVLGHAVLYHLSKCRCAVDFKGPFHRLDDFLYIIFIDNITLEKETELLLSRMILVHQRVS